MKFSVLTFIFGDYEMPHDPVDISKDIEYICVTDNPNLKSDVWKIIYDPINPEYTPFRKVVETRYNPFKYVTNDICMIIDGCIQIRNTPWKWIDFFSKNRYDISTLVHPARNNTADELEAWKHLRGLDPITANSCMKILQSIGCDLNIKGLFQIGVMLIKKNDIIERFFNKTLSVNNACQMIAAGGIFTGKYNDTFRADQIVFSAIINSFFKQTINILPVSSDELRGHFFGYYDHNTNNMYSERILDTTKPQRLYVLGELSRIYNICDF